MWMELEQHFYGPLLDIACHKCFTLNITIAREVDCLLPQTNRRIKDRDSH